MAPTRAQLVPVLALVVALVAGCVGGGNGDTSDRPRFDDDTGAIRGIVLNEDLLPVAGAEASIPTLGLSATTNAEGRFLMSHVEPGTHALHVLRIGFEEARRDVTVAAGRVTDVEVPLTVLALAEPFHLVHTQRGLFGCGASWAPGIPPEPGPGFNDLPGTEGLPHRIGGIAGCGILDETPLEDFDEFQLDGEVDTGFPTSQWMSSVFEMTWTTNQIAGRGLCRQLQLDEVIARDALIRSSSGEVEMDVVSRRGRFPEIGPRKT